ncbi:MAG: preprotein translocase subunit SecY [Pelotomaculum sp. PtaB.Bin013]|uniref:Protein translocase subunit SecY n=1 Tax=Pelotomaculum isophthalicicum JI TaxID=947010 RepID=A0A9X4H1F8_9FIRM|nr:preprotein translocase subunit SecY [Pelotomaculum isophthalicicum]MDF9407561.1 preprotein translocase subunit SecY [Pelotomaculum isophthalicicum JI]OPX90911.1 MAG: preprotein translocase subunit SecY [Pelotomaculum sp. PtaB.Bin013]
MLGSFANALKATELRTKILYTLGLIFVFRLGAHIPVPGVNPERFAELVGSGAIFGFFDVISGGALKNFSVFAMGIMPYINASIIMQLLTVVIPHLERLNKEGEEGRKKITQYTRYLTVVLAFIQGIGMVVGVSGSLQNPGLATYLMTAITITAGTTFLMWTGEQITEKGIGNGISLLIFAGIVSRIPAGIVRVVEYLNAGTINILSLLLLIVIGALVIAGVVTVQEGQRRIPVQYAKRVVGRRVYGGQTTHLPLRVNQAGVIPVIFASSLLMFPETIVKWFSNSGAAAFYTKWFGWGTVAHTVIYALLIIGFTFFYTAVIMNPVDMADNIKKYGGFIPGLRPGRPTAEYISRIMNKITLAGAIFLALVAILPNFVLLTTRIPNIYFGGTALLIVVGVALDTMKQVESHMLMRSYQGFIK